MTQTELLRVEGLTKRFGSITANEGVDLALHEGEILGLLGENGAGKSTLVKMIFGIHKPDEGTIFMDGEEVTVTNPGFAIDRGVGMVHQHFQLVPPLSVAENIVLGAEPMSGMFFSRTAAEAEVKELSQRFGLEVDPAAIVEDLPVGIQQRVEILKALYRGARLLILDEPTAVLTPQETDELLEVMRQLAANGVGIIFITHKLREVLAVTDRVTVLRNGVNVGTAETNSATQASLAELMVGRSVVLRVEKGAATEGEVVLDVNGLVVEDDRGQAIVDGLSLQVRAGEILGIAGVEGNGQRELVEALTGIRPVKGGSMAIGGVDTTNSSPRQVSELGTAHIPEDREKDGLVAEYSLADNLVLNTYFKSPYARNGVRQTDVIDQRATELIKKYDVRTSGIHATASSLSGGNKQKVIVARELSANNKLVIASQPTRGVDIGSIEFIHSQLIAQRDAGIAVLLVSAELDEILALSDRIAVLYEGEVVGIVSGSDATREEIGLLMAGGSKDGATSE